MFRLPRLLLVLLVPVSLAAQDARPPSSAPQESVPQEGAADRWETARQIWRNDGPWGLFGRLASARVVARWAADGLEFDHAGGRFRFEDGEVALLAADGVPVLALFRGAGTFLLETPDPVERWQLTRILGRADVHLALDGAVLFLGEEVGVGLQAALGSPEATVDEAPPEDELLRRALDWASAQALTRALVNGEDHGFLHAHLSVVNEDDHAFTVSHRTREEVSFRRKSEDGDFFRTLSTFHLPDEYPDPDPAETDRPTTQVLHYETEAWITPGPDFAARATLHLSSELSAGSWIPFTLSSRLSVDSLRWGSGREVRFLRPPEESPWLWVQLPDDAGFQQLTAWYHGKTVEFDGNWYRFDRPTSWYPRVGRTDATFDMTFHTDDRYEFLGSGRRTERVESDGVETSRWVVESPVSQASFNLGDFEEFNAAYPGVPPIRLHVNQRFHDRLMRQAGWAQDKGVAESVAADLASALQFFEQVFGPVGVEEFNASEIPYMHGQAFPGLIHLSAATFFSLRDEEGYQDAFRAHEVAHQWWGYAVEPASYRDRWLSEGMAEFSGLWYLQRARFDHEAYMEHLKRSREQLVRRRGRAGPLSLGTRVALGGRDEDYSLVVYQKGAWVVHMLRNLFMNLDTMDDEAFVAFLHDLVERHRHTRITTDAFQAVVEAHLGADMQWFFDQWVHGVDIPRYRWAATGEETPEGYRMQLRVHQDRVPEDFRMVVPVTLDFGEEGVATVRILVSGSETVAPLPLMPREPDEVVFNDFESVLAEVERESW